MRCPICKRETTSAPKPYRPFCSARCKLIDLDHWLEGRYRASETSDAGRNSEEPKDESSDSDDDSQ